MSAAERSIISETIEPDVPEEETISAARRILAYLGTPLVDMPVVESDADIRQRFENPPKREVEPWYIRKAERVDGSGYQLPVQPEVPEQATDDTETEVKSLNLDALKQPIAGLKSHLNGLRTKAVELNRDLQNRRASVGLWVVKTRFLRDTEDAPETAQTAEPEPQIVQPAHEAGSVGGIKEIIRQRRVRKAAMVVGGLALSTAAAWGISRGFSVGDHSVPHVQEHLNLKAHLNAHPGLPAIKPPAVSHPEVTHVIAKAADTKTKLNQIFVKPGEGISQKIRDAYPGRSPADYAQVTKAATAKFGSHIIDGISKYRMSDGSWGLSHAGKAHWGPHVQKFLQSYFSHKSA